MLFKKIISILDNISITGKITLGFTSVFSIFAFLSFFFYHNIKADNENLLQIAKLSKNTSTVLNINREISEIQRLTNVYSLTGGKSIIEKIRNTYTLLTEDLVAIKQSTKSEERKKLVESLSNTLNSYGQNIESLEERYNYRQHLVTNKLPKLKKHGLLILTKYIKQSTNKKNYKKIISLQKIESKWHELNSYAHIFIEKKDYKYKLKIKKCLSDIRNIYSAIDKGHFDKNKEILQLLKDFDKTFDQAIQANRIYLSLINVVMAGAAIEFTTISKTLRTESLDELDNLLKKSEDNFQLNIQMMIVCFLLTLPLLLLVGIYYQFSIANGIKNISNTFKSFIQGDLDHSIPGLARKDEIGQLANAANTFKDISKKIKEEQAKAQKLTQSKSRFLATMSHEIRTPMNAVLSCTHLLLDEITDKEHKKLLDTIKTSGDSLLILINDILDFSKIESGKINLEKASFNLHDTIESVINLLGTNASQRNILVDTEIDLSLPSWVLGDTTRLRQVLVNLVGNAIKFTNNKVKISISSKAQKNEYVEVLFSIKDNGIGMDQKAQNKLFKEFTQVDTSTTRKFGGTGLGLAISKGIVVAMGGKIWVESTINKGSVFSFSITFQKSTPQRQSSKKMNSSVMNSHLAEEFPLKILIAEDNNVNQMVAQKMLAKLGYRIDIVSNGLEAVEIVQHKSYDIIFMDQHMPEMDGIDATKAIRKLDITQPKIYALTASAFQEDKDRCFDAGMDGFLSKPISLNEICAALKESCQPKKTSKTA